MKAKKTWAEKLSDDKDLPRIMNIDALMQRVSPGRLTTINELREALAKKHGATIACPTTTGIFAWIAAHAADEAERMGRADITPYWRTLKAGGELNAKYPGGPDALRARLEAEGHRVIAKGRRWMVADCERVLFRTGSTQRQKICSMNALIFVPFQPEAGFLN